MPKVLGPSLLQQQAVPRKAAGSAPKAQVHETRPLGSHHVSPKVGETTGFVAGGVPKPAQVRQAGHRIDMSMLEEDDGFQSADSYHGPQLVQ